MISRPSLQSTPKKQRVDSRLNIIQRILFPPRCLLCNGWGAEDLDLCAGCYRDLPWLRPACQRCGLPLPDGAGSPVCGACTQAPPPFIRTHIAFRYQFPVDRLIADLKYRRQTPPARLFGELLAEQLPAQAHWCPPDRVIPVPLHPRRQRQRGFNQAELIARFACHRLDLPMDTQSLRRTSNTPPQQGLSAEQRRRNLRHAFTVADALRDLRVALVDDVMTTGTTLTELAQLCLAAGAREIQCWAVARTPTPDDRQE